MAKKSAAHPVGPQSRRLTSVWICLALAAVTLLVYRPVAHFQFVTYDDPDFVTANPHVQAGLTMDGFKWVWHSEVARNWHPITMLAHMFDCQLFGLNPGGPHLVNLLLHIANSILLFFLLKSMTQAIWRSAFIAALFALHPLHVESVAWIAERKDVLSTFFWFASIWAYVRYTRGQRVFYFVSLLLFALGLMSKPMLVTGPFLLVLLDFWPLNRMKSFRPLLVWEKIPFLLMSAALCVVTYLIQLHGGAVQAVTRLPMASRVENALVSYLRYIGNMFWPHNLAGLYLRTGDWPMWLAIAAALALIGLSILVIIQRRARPWLAAGWLWYIGTLVPVIGIVQVGMQTMADRFTYVSLIGLFIIVTWGACELAGKWRWPDFSLATAAAVILVACAFLAANQVYYWKNSEALFKRMIVITKNNYIAHYNLANLYSQQRRLDEATAEYRAALEEEPNYSEARNNFGNLLLEQKHYEEALEQYTAAIRANPQPVNYLNYANTLADMASARRDTNIFAAAVRAYGQAIAVDPTSSQPHCNLGLTWDAQGKESEAAAEFREAIRLKPDNEQAHFNLGKVLSGMGKLEDATVEYLAADRLNPGQADTYDALGICYAMQNKMPEATAQFLAVIQLQPNNAAAEGNLANALGAQGKFDEAFPHYTAAIRLNPKDPQTEFNLGLTLTRQGKREEAATHFQQALRLNPHYSEARRALADLQSGVNNQK